MKKLIAILCALTLVLSLGTAAFASGEASGEAAAPVEPGTVVTAPDGSVTVTGGVVETVSADVLTLQDVAPVDGKLLTLVVGGVETAIENGTYYDAVLVVTNYIHAEDGLYSGGMTNSAGTAWRTAILIDDGELVADNSVTQAVQSGVITKKAAQDVVIDSDGEQFNGFIINNSDYTIDGMFMTADGSGGNDFTGFGAGIANTGTSNTTINGLVFFGNGALRHGVYVGGTSADLGLTVTVNDSYIKANGSMYDIHTTGMSACPWMLGISPEGHSRATMADGFARVYYNDSVLLSDGWGILSTDDVSAPDNWGELTLSLIVNNTVVDVTTESTDDPSAYATYAIGACHNYFTGCHVGNAMGGELYNTNVAKLADYGVSYAYPTVEYGLTYGAVVANETAGVSFEDSIVNTKYGVMYHKTNNVRFPGGVGNVAEDGVTEAINSVFKTYGAAFLVKACTPVIEVTNSLFQPEKGVIVQLMTCDDPGMGAANFSETLFTDADAFAAGLAVDPDYDPYDYNLVSRTLLNTPVENYISDVQVSFADCNDENGTALDGDFYNSISVSTTGEGMTWFGQNLILSFDNCDINGNASSSSALHVEYGYYTDDAGNVIEAADTAAAIAAGATTGVIDSTTATLLGNLDNTPTATVNNGVWVKLSNGSVWTPNSACYITRLEVDATSAVNGTVTVDGTVVVPEAGVVYTGQIVVTPAQAGNPSGNPSGEAS